MANSRLKDFYNLWPISQTFEFHRSVLLDAVRRTFERRVTARNGAAVRHAHWFD